MTVHVTRACTLYDGGNVQLHKFESSSNQLNGSDRFGAHPTDGPTRFMGPPNAVQRQLLCSLEEALHILHLLGGSNEQGHALMYLVGINVQHPLLSR